MKKNIKDSVRLRERKLANGNISLYIDIYSNGCRKYEFLKLYLVPEDSKEAKAHNRETMDLAQSIVAQRMVEARSKKFGFGEDNGNDILFFDFLDTLISRKAGTTKTSWENCRSHLMRYEPDKKIPLKKINERWVRGFRDYLESKAMQWSIDGRKHNVDPKPISQGTKALMFQKLGCVVNEAVKKGLLHKNP